MSYDQIMYGGGKTGPSNYDLYVISAGILGGEVLTEAEWMETKAKPFWIPAGGEAWAADFEYLPGMATHSGGSLWLARAESVGVEPVDGAIWAKLIDGIDQALFDALLVEAESARDVSVSAKDTSVIAASSAVAAQALAEAARDASQSSALTCGTWATLNGLTGVTAGTGAEVLDSDTGAHTDPVVGGTVANAGRYTWSAAPAGWQRIGETGLAGVNTKIGTVAGAFGAMSPFETLDQSAEDGLQFMDPDGRIVGFLPADRDYSSVTNDTVFETLAETDVGFVVADPNGHILFQAPADLSGAVVAGEFETLDPDAGIVISDLDGRIVASIPLVSGTGDSAEVVAARGNRDSLSARLSVALDAYGAPRGPTYGAWALREMRMRTRRLEMGQVDQWVLAIIGDSFTQRWTRYTGPVTEALWDKYGFAGVGYCGLSWAGASGTTWVLGGAQPSLGDSIYDLTRSLDHGNPWAKATYSGAWVAAYNSVSTNGPSISKATSSTADNFIRFEVTKAGHDEAVLFYSGCTSGVVAVSWDDGATYSAGISLANTVAGFVTLPGCPATTFNMRVKVVSGAVGLCGIDFRSSAAGVRVHKLGGSGSTSSQWAAVTGATWGAMLEELAPNTLAIMHGTNDQTASTAAATVAANISTIAANVTGPLPACDVMVLTPPENNRTTNPVAMADYEAAMRSLAVQRDWAHLALQSYFGSAASYGAAYAAANPDRPWFNADLTHPEPTYPVIADAVIRFFENAV